MPEASPAGRPTPLHEAPRHPDAGAESSSADAGGAGAERRGTEGEDQQHPHRPVRLAAACARMRAIATPAVRPPKTPSPRPGHAGSGLEGQGRASVRGKGPPGGGGGGAAPCMGGRGACEVSQLEPGARPAGGGPGSGPKMASSAAMRPRTGLALPAQTSAQRPRIQVCTGVYRHRERVSNELIIAAASPSYMGKW
eukprot:scaffold1786_cov398-Prasinococcus_capsulatus_cf.AAC.28